MATRQAPGPAGATVMAPPGSRERVGNFNRATRQSLVTLSSQTWPGTAGNITTLDLPQTGFFAGLYLDLQGTITTAGGSSTTEITWPLAPFGFLRRIRVYNNQNVELWNTSGYDAYVYARTLWRTFDPAKQGPNFIPSSTVWNNVTNPWAQYYVEPTALGASASINMRAPWFIPIAWGAALEHGLQPAQDPSIRYTLELTWGDITDVTSATTGTATVATTTKVKVMTEIYQVPEDEIDYPALRFSKIVTSDEQALVNGSGDNDYQYRTGNVCTKLFHEVTNGSTRNPIDPNSITNFKLKYAQVQSPYVVDADLQYFLQRMRYGTDLPPGWLVWDFGLGSGVPQRPNTRDVLNTSRLTDLTSTVTLSGVTLSSGKMRTIREQLAINR